MCQTSETRKESIVVFCPFDISEIRKCSLYGDYEVFSDSVYLIFITKIFHVTKSKAYVDIFNENSKFGSIREEFQSMTNSLFVETKNGIFSIKQIKIDSRYKSRKNYNFVWINYDFRLFSLCEFTSKEGVNAYSEQSYFKHLKDKINEKMYLENNRRIRHVGHIANVFLAFLSAVLLSLHQWSVKLLPVTKYLNIAVHINNYLNAFLWAVESVKDKKKLDIKVTNFFLSVLMDMILGILFLYWLNSKVSLDSSASLFLFTAEYVVHSINDLINWLRGDPAGLKLNWAYNSILATFFSFYINIWWTFIVYVKSVVQIIFQVFLKLGLLGITFQASIMADLFALVSLHIHYIHVYATKLYSIQITSLISLWRLFLGRKKNPLRGKVDSCRYSSKQLFVGTLAFTILLFLLPTTLLYYVVFTSIKLLIKIMEAALKLIQYFNQALPVYTTILWLKKSPKIYGSIEIEKFKKIKASNCILLNVKPGMCSWWETVRYFTPDCAAKSFEFNLPNFFNSVLTGKLETHSRKN